MDTTGTKEGAMKLLVTWSVLDSTDGPSGQIVLDVDDTKDLLERAPFNTANGIVADLDDLGEYLSSVC